MRSFFVPGRRPVTVITAIAIITSASLSATDLSVETIVAKHLDSIGSAQTRNGIKSRVIQAPAAYRILVGGSGAIDGKCVIATEGRKSNFLFKINASGYRGEQFIFDGNKLSIAGTYNDKSRSDFGEFLLSQDIGLKDNLLGGVWSVAWPLLDLESHKAKLHFEGTKKIDGRDVLAVRYQPKKGTDLNIVLFFDPQTYRHVMTSYRVSRAGGIGEDEMATARKQETRYLIEERFSEFQTFDGLTFPTHYDLRYTQELDNGFTKSVEWDVREANIINNISIDARSFEVK